MPRAVGKAVTHTHRRDTAKDKVCLGSSVLLHPNLRNLVHQEHLPKPNILNVVLYHYMYLHNNGGIHLFEKNHMHEPQREKLAHQQETQTQKSDCL